MNISFLVPGEPIPKPRPRFRHVVAKSGVEFTQTYTPAKGAKYEKTVGQYALVALRASGIFSPFVGPIELACEFRFHVPKSWTKKRTILALEGQVFPTSPRQDVDNCLKSVQDGLNGVAWADDGQVVTLSARKVFHATPAAVVTIKQIDKAAP